MQKITFGVRDLLLFKMSGYKSQPLHNKNGCNWSIMAVRLGKYSGSLGVCARKYVLCAKTFLLCAEKNFFPNIYITCTEKQLYECENIYLTAQKFFGLRRNLWACAKIFSPSAENYVMRGNILKSCNFILFCAEYITSHAQILLFWECRGAVVRN